jgi:formate hydrogenlyase transcriptional activator
LFTIFCTINHPQKPSGVMHMSLIVSPPDLDPNEHDSLLALFALFEGEFSIDWISELTGKKPSQIIVALEKGIRQGLLITKAPGVFYFRDLKEREKYAGFLTSGERKQIHTQISDLLTRIIQDEKTKAQVITPYLLRSSNDLEKCRYLILFAGIHLEAFQPEIALRCYTKVLEDLSALPGREADLLFIEAAIQYSKISTARHDTTSVLSILRDAVVRAVRWGTINFQALLEMHIAKNEWLLSQYPSALAHFKQGWNLAKNTNDNKLFRSATTFSTFFLYWQGLFRDAVLNYEKYMPDVEKFPEERFPTLAAMTVGRCYAHIGQVTQGIGLLDNILLNSKEKGDLYTETNAEVALSAIMIDIGRIDDALSYLEHSLGKVGRQYSGWKQFIGNLLLAFAYYLKRENKKSIDWLKEFLQNSRQVHVTVMPNPHLMDLCWAMEEGKLPCIEGFSLEGEVKRMITSENIFIKGVAYRYKALLQKQNGTPLKDIIQSLNLSLRCLEQSGNLFELAKSELELSRQYLLLGDELKAKTLISKSSKILSSLNEVLVPEDLRAFIEEPATGKKVLKEILKLGQDIVTIRDNKEVAQHILSTGNRLTGAERGAIFLLEGNTSAPILKLRASKNLTAEQISHPSFSSSMKMVKEVALSVKGRIFEMSSTSHLHSSSMEGIRSRICVPMILKGKVTGVLYHDNRLLSSIFQESDLELLAHFAALAAFALDNASAYEEIRKLNQKLGQEKLYFEEEHLKILHSEEIIGKSSVIREILVKVDQVANTDTTVLILGETGVGKELVARAIHRNSSRMGKPFIQINCSDFPETLISAELFGHEKGAFTGAIRRRIGRFELADGGTLFMDEIGDLSLEVQTRLLRVLQNKEFERIGGNETIRSDFRLVVASNRNLQQEVKTKRFREDLYFRLNVFPIYVPPLRERKEDIPLIAQYFLKIHATKMAKTFYTISESEMEKLIKYDWPGNIRELENIIERGVILSREPYFQVPQLFVTEPRLSETGDDTTLSENERRHILWALQKTGWKIRGPSGAAELLDIHPSTLAFRMKKLGIHRPEGILKKRYRQYYFH